MIFDLMTWHVGSKAGLDLYIGNPKIMETDEKCSKAINEFCYTWKSQDVGHKHVSV
jgi:hypothetical protein